MVDMSTERRIAIFERMLLMRRFEESVAALAEAKAFSSHYHLYIGQEATGAAVLEALKPDDLVVTTHRNHGHVIGRGADPGRALAEILGRAGGTNRGRGGTLHLCDRPAGFLSTSAMVGAAIGLASGGAYALKRRGGGLLCAAFFGERSLEEGIAFETMNLAALWSLPVLFVCENNSVAMKAYTDGPYPASDNAAERLVDIPRSLGIPSEPVDGGDADAVFALVYDAANRIRDGGGPVFVEAVTESWPGSRPLWPALLTGATDLKMAWGETTIAGEHADWIRDHDPVLRLARALVAGKQASAEDLLAIDARVTDRMAEAKAFAIEDPYSAAETYADGVFAGAGA